MRESGQNYQLICFVAPCAMPPSPNRSRWPLFAAGGCVLLLACAIVAGAAAALLYLRRPAATAATPSVEYILDASPRMLDENAGATRLSVASSDVRAAQVSSDPGVASALAGINPLCTAANAIKHAITSVDPMPAITPLNMTIS